MERKTNSPWIRVTSTDTAQTRICKQRFCLFQELPDGCAGNDKSIETFSDTIFQTKNLLFCSAADQSSLSTFTSPFLAPFPSTWPPAQPPPNCRYWVKTGAAMHCEAQCKVLLSVHRAFHPLDPVHSLSPLHWNPSTGENHNRHSDPECISKLRSLLEGTAPGLLIQTPRGQKGFETPNQLKLSSLTFSSQPSS